MHPFSSIMLRNFSAVTAVLIFCAACGSAKIENDEELSSSSGTPSHLQKRILVMNVQNKTNMGGETLAKDAKETIEKWIKRHSEFIYVPLTEVDPEKTFLTEEGNYDMSAIFDAVLGTNINAVMLTEIEEIEMKEGGEETGFFRNRETSTSARVRIRVVDLRTQKEIFAKRKTATYSEENVLLLGSSGEPQYDAKHGKLAVSRAVAKLLDELPPYAKRIDWAGQIARIEGTRIFIDAGRITGLQRGQVLQVFDPEKPVLNAANKKPLGFTRGRYKGTVQIFELMGEDASIALAHSGHGFAELDRVELFLPREK